MAEITRSNFVLSETEVDAFVANNGYLTSAPVTSVYGRTGVVVAVAGDYTGAQVTNVAAGTISAITTQAAINELDSEKLALAGGTMSGEIAMGTSKITGLGTPTLAADATTKAYVDTAVAGVPTAPVDSVYGRTGVVTATAGDYSANLVTNVAAGNIAATDVQAAINELDTEKLALSGGTMSGAINMSSNLISNLATPIAGTDATTKAYVDTAVAGAAGAPGGASTQVQFNNAGAFAGNANFVWDNVNSRLGIGTASPRSVLEIGGAIQIANDADPCNAGKAGAIRYAGGVVEYCNAIAWTAFGTAAGGEVNTASNVGTAGVGVFDLKSGVQLQFKRINGASNKIVVTDDVINRELDIDVVEANIDHDALSNFDANEHIDHSAVNISAGGGLTGGGDLTVTRTLAVDIGTGAAQLKQNSDVPNCLSNQKLEMSAGPIYNWSCVADLDTNTNSVASVFGRTGVVTATAGDYTATQVTNTPAGNITATTIQTALNELDTEKLALAGGTMSGDIAMGTSKITGLGTPTLAADATTKAYVDTAIAGTSSGTVTSVATGSGLTGGTITSTGTIAIDVPGTADLVGLVDGADSILIYDDSGAALAEITRSNFVLSETEVDAFVANNGYLTSAPVTSVYGRTGVVVALAGDYTGAQVTNVAAGNITAVTTQAAINELDSEKLALAGGTMSGAVNMGSNLISNLGTPVAGTDASTKAYVDTAIAGTSSGTVTSVATGSGLTGGTITGAGTIAIDVPGTADLVGLVDGADSILIYDDSGAALAEITRSNFVLSETEVDAFVANNGYLTSAPVTSVYGRTGVVVAMDDDYTSSQINNTAAGNIVATDVQAAINELDVEKLALAGGTMSGAVNMGSNLISNLATPVAGTDATTKAYVDTAVAGVPSAPVDSVYGRTGVVTATAGDYSANLVTNVAAGNIAATEVQAAINELDTEKLALVGGTMSGDIAMGTSKITGLGTPTLAADATTKSYVDTAVAGAAGAPGGASTQVQFNDAGAFAGDSNFVWDNTNKRLGIGTATPRSILEIGGAIQIANDADPCNAGKAGAIRYAGGVVEYCNAIAWTAFGTAAGGEVNTASNVGTAGVGVFDLKSGVQLQFKRINGASNKIAVTDDVINRELDIDVVEANIDHDALSNFIANEHIDHTSVSITAGSGLTGGGNIAADRTIAVDIPGTADLVGAVENTDTILMYDDSGAALAEITRSNFVLSETEVDAFVANNGYLTSAPVDSVYGRTGVVVALAGDYTGSQVTNVAAGNIAATTTQAAINELDTEKLALAGGTMSGAVNMGSNLISNLATPVAGTDATTKAYVDTAIAGVPSAPVDSVYGRTGVVVAMDDDYTSSQINNTAAGNILATDVQAAINELDTEKLALAGGTMSGDIAMGTSKITGLGAPTLAADATTKAYVDTAIAGTSSGTVTSVATGSGLTGGTITDSGTIAIDIPGTADLVGAVENTDTILMYDDSGAALAEITRANFVLSETEVDAFVANNGYLTSAPVTSVYGRTGLVVALAGDYTGSQVTNVAAGNIAATTTQAAINELDTEKLALAGGTMSGAIEMGTNKISGLGAPTLAADATTKLYVDTAVAGVPSAPVDSVYGRTGVVVAMDDDYTSSQINNTAAGNILATDVQAAINELDTEKLALAGGTMSGAINMGSNLISNLATPVAGTDATTKAYVDTAIAGTSSGTVTSVATGSGLTGGTITDSGTIAIDIPGTADLVGAVENTDTILMYDDSGAALAEITRANFVLSETEVDAFVANNGYLTSAPVTSVYGRTGVIVALAGDYTGSQVTNVAAGNIAATTTQAAINELDTEKLALAGGTMSGDITMGLNTVTGLRAPTASTDATTKLYVDTAVAGVPSAPVDSVYGRTGVVVALAGDYTGSQIVNTAAGNIAATTTQAAINELDSEKLALAGGTMSGDIAMGTSKITGLGTPTLAADATTKAYVDAQVASSGSGTVTSVATGSGLTGGTITDSGTIAIDVPGTADLVGAVENADTILMYDDSGSALAEITRSNFVLSETEVDAFVANNGYLTSAPVDSVYGRTGVVVALAGDYTGAQVTNVAAGNIAAITTQAAINELDAEKLALAGGTMSGAISMDSNLITNLATPVSATDASTKAYVDTAIAGVPSAPVDSVYGRTGAVVATAGDYTGAQVTNVAAGNIAAMTTQAAINELDTEKLAVAGGTMSGAVNMGSNLISNLATPVAGTDATTKDYVDTAIAGVPSGADNLGNHTATTNIQLDGNYLSGDGGNEGLFVDSTGRVGLGITNPASSFHVGGNLLGIGESVDTTDEYIVILNAGATSGTYRQDRVVGFSARNSGTGVGNNSANMGLHTTYKFEFFNAGSGTPFVVMNAEDGFVGVGTESPAVELDVNTGSINAAEICDEDNTNCIDLSAPQTTGTVTSVATGTGLTGGPITGTGTISIANQGVDTLQLANDAVTTTQIENGTIVNADISANTIDATTKLTSACSDNQILQVSGVGGNFVCANLPTPPAAPVTSVFGRTGVILALDDDYTSSQINNTAAGNISATDVQAAINELDTEKLALAGGTMSGAIAMGTNKITGLGTPTLAADATTKSYVDTAIAGAAGSPGGATTQVQFNNAGSFDGDANFVWNNVSGRLGIGTATPTGILDVQGGAAAASTGGLPINLVAQDSTGPSGSQGGSVNISVGAGAGGWQDGDVVMDLANNGRLFMGRNNTSTYASSGAGYYTAGSGVHIENDSAIDNSFSLLNFQARNSNLVRQNAYIGAVANAGGGSYTPDVVLGQQTGASSYIERMRIDSSGNVGIGTTSPQALLQISDESRSALDDLSQKSNYTLHLGGHYQTGRAGGSISFGDANNIGASIVFIDQGSNSPGDLAFYTKPLPASPAPIERLRIASDGNVGIGTTAPAVELDVNTGSINASEICDENNANCIDLSAAQTNGTVTSVATGTGLTGGPITGSGTVSIANQGVGTLQLANDAVTTTQIANGTIVNADISANTINAVTKLTSACTNNQILQVSGGSGNFVCANAPTAPVTSVYGRTGVVVALDDDYTSSQINNTAAGSIASTDVQAAINELDTEKLALAGGTMSGVIAMGTNKITGLGTPTLAADAATKAYVDGVVAGGSGDFLADGSVPMTGKFLAAAGSFGVPSISFAGDDDTGFYSAYGGGMAITGNGNVLFYIDVNGMIGTVDGSPKITSSNGIETAPTYAFRGDEDTGMYRPADNQLGLSTGGAERLRIDSSGNVGIGTDSPGYKLQVQDSSVATGSVEEAAAFTYMYVYPSSSSAAKFVAQFNGTENSSTTANITGEMIGNLSYAGHNSVNSVEALGGSWSGALNKHTGTANKAVGSQATVANQSTGVITTAIGLHSSVLNPGGGTLTNSFGLFVDEVAGTNKWSIFTDDATAPVFFSGDVGIGIGAEVPVHPIEMASGARVTAAGVWTNASDRRLKDKIIPLEKYGIETIFDLKPTSYVMKKGGEEQIGFIAQDLLEVVPEIVSTKGKFMGVSYGQLSAVIVKAFQDFYTEFKVTVAQIFDRLTNVETQVAQIKKESDEKISKLEAKNNKLEQELAEIKSLLFENLKVQKQNGSLRVPASIEK